MKCAFTLRLLNRKQKEGNTKHTTDAVAIEACILNVSVPQFGILHGRKLQGHGASVEANR